MLSDFWLLLFIVVLVAGAIAGQPVVAALGTLGFLASFIARIWSRLSLERVTYTRAVSTDRLIVGDEFELTLTIDNKKPLPLPWLKARDYVPADLEILNGNVETTPSPGLVDLVTTTSLTWYERVRFHHTLRATKRGFYRFGPVRIESGDLFGLFHSALEAPSRDAVIVYPETVPLPGFFLPSGRPVGEARSNVRLWDDPARPNGLREYQPGDAMKTIDWKATARHQDLLVRTFDPSVSQYAVVIVDVFTAHRPWEGYNPDLLERAVTAAASVARRAAEIGYRVGLVTNGIPLSEHASMVLPPSSGPGQLSLILEALAMVRPLAVKRLEEVVETEGAAIPFGSTAVVISAVFGDGLQEMAARLAARGHPTVALYVGNDEPPAFVPRCEVRNMGDVFDPGQGQFVRPREAVPA